MNQMLGKMLLIIGGIFILLGVMFLLAPRIPFLGRLPGDISYQGRNTQVFFPITTCIIVSLILTLILSLIKYFR